MLPRRVLVALAVAGILAAVPGNPGGIGPEPLATDAILYGVIGSRLVFVDRTTGDASDLGGTGFGGFEALAFDEDTNTLYGVADGTTDPKLVRINRRTGQGTLVGPIDLASPFIDLHLAEALAWNPENGLLYAAASEFGVPQGSSRSDRLVTVDPSTGAATMVAYFSGVEEADAMAFAGNTLYLSNTAPPQTFLYTANEGTGEVTFVGEVGYNHVADLAYDSDSDTLFGSPHTDRILISISRTTGEGSTIGTTHTPSEFGGATLVGLAVAPATAGIDLPCDFAVSQGTHDYDVTPVDRSQSIGSFYDYFSVSAHTPFVEAYASVLFLYYDTAAGTLHLVFHFNIDDGGSPDAEATVGLSGIPAGSTVEFSDDPGEFALSRFPQGQFHYFTNTDGGVLGPIPANVSWTMTADVAHFGVDPMRAQRWIDWDGAALPLDLSGTIMIKSVCNQVPAGDAGGPYAAPEGTPITFDASASSDPDGDPLTYRWDFDADGTWDTDWSADPTTSYTWGDDRTGTVVLEVSDGELSDTASVSIAVTNVSPRIESTTIPSGDEAGSLLFKVQVADPGSDDLVVSWSGACTGWSAPTTYANDPAAFPDPDPSPDVHPRDITDRQTVLCGDDGTFVWTVKAVDDDGGETTSGGTFSVGNLAPSLTIPPPSFVTVDEGIAWTLTATAEDAGSDDLTFVWTWEDGPTEASTYFNDGVGPDPDGSWDGTYPFAATDTSTHTYGDDGTFTVTLRVEDDDDGFLEVTTTFSTTNLPPALTISPPSSTTVDEGTLVTLTATAEDPGSDDLTFTWTWTHGPTETNTYFNDGVGPDPDPSPGGTFPFTASDSSSRIYGDDCACLVTLRVEDDDGGVLTVEAAITVVNVDPTVLTSDASGDEAASIAFAATFSDPGFDLGAGDSFEDFTATVDWGDGSSETVSVTEIPGGPGILTTGSLAASHVYGDNGAFVVTATVCDDNDGCGTATASITVLNVAPSPSIDEVTQGDAHLPVGRFFPLDPIAFNGSGVDVGSDDLTLSWSWGDGTADTVGATHFNDGVGPDPFPSPDGAYPFSAKDSVDHTYALPGDYVVTLTATDDDGGTAQTSIEIHVTSAADLKDEAIERIRALKQTALDRGDMKFVRNLDDAERFVWRSLGYADPLQPATIAAEPGTDVTVGKNEGDRIDLVLGPSWTPRLAAYGAIQVSWANDIVTTVDLPDGWPSKRLRYDDQVWVDAWEQDLAIESKRDKKTGQVTLKVFVHDASLGFSLSLDSDVVADLAFTYEILPYWIDGAHLDPKLGANVFVCEAAAVDRLVKLVIADDDEDDDGAGGDDDGERDGDRGGSGILGGGDDGDDDDDEDDDRKVRCGCDDEDGCDDGDDDDGGDDDRKRDGERRDAGVLGGDDDDADDDKDDDKGCRCGDDDDEDDEDDGDEDDNDGGDDDDAGVRTVHCRLTPKLWSDAKRAELDATCDAIANLLVKADEILARIALEEAKETPVNDPANQARVDREIAKSEKSMAKAFAEWELLEYRDAICRFLRAWEQAQRAIRIAGK